MPLSPKERPFSFSLLEYAPDYIIHAPHVPYGLWLWAKYGDLTLPAIANPSIFLGGIVGESKTDMFDLVGEHARKYFAPFITIYADEPLVEIERKLEEAGLAYPLVAKPDIGRNGRGIKIVHSGQELERHLALFPPRSRMLVQRYIADEGEAGVFYVRKPSEKNGRITSLTLKYFPRVTGDGKATLRELILRDPRASKIAGIYFRRNKRNLEHVIPRGEEYRLVSVGNHVRGALFVDGGEHITPEMSEAFDRIAKDIRGFYFGRFDVRFADLEDLKHGEKFTLLEYNGASSEPTHVWDPRMKPLAIWRSLLEHWRLAFEVGAEHRALGVTPIPLSEILRVNRAESALINRYPDEE